MICSRTNLAFDALDARSAHRPVRIRTPLGRDTVLVHAVRGTEAVSIPFEYEIELISSIRRIDPGDLIGAPVTLDIDHAHDGVRYINGIVWSCQREPDQGRFVRLRLVLVPWLRLLEQSQDCRIFQNMTAPAIIKQVFRDHGYGAFRDELSREYPKREYCVQYRESALDFVSRLMEDEGISYRFDHFKSRHELVLLDDTPSADASPVCPCVPFREPPAANDRDERVWDWIMERHLRPSRYAQTDFDFEQPNKPLLARANAPWSPSASTHEIFDYPGGYRRQAHGEQDSGLRIEQIHADQTACVGQTNARGLSAGWTLRVDHDPFENRDYFVTSVGLSITLDDYESETIEQVEPIYSAQFTAIPANRGFHAPRRTARPIVQGPQTAEVVGPADKEIYTDEHGRVKVHFHWDRYGNRDQMSSCWIRVSQAWGGKGFGGVTVPRIGQEVIVDFLEGDPDRPIITGRVYNGSNRSSLNLPADAMKTSLRSNSLAKTGGYNEIVMDDTSGKEGVHIRSQYDHSFWIGNDRTGEVGNDSSERVGNNLTQEIVNNASEKVGVNKVIDVGSNLVIKAGTSITLKCGASTLHMNQAGFITISGTVLNIAGSINCNMVAPITNVAGAVLLTNTGAVNLSTGVVTRVEGTSLGHFGGGTAELVGTSETLVNAPAVKIN